MTDDAFIERIVQEVIRRLLAMDANADRKQSVPATNGSSLTIKDRVVALASLDGRLDGTSEVIVQRNAVVTPSVQDELRDRKIKLVRKSD